MKPDINDKAYVEALQKGDASAFDRLFGKYSGRLYAFGLKYLRSKEDAEGLVQTVFLKVWDNRLQLRNDTSFQSYLFTIAYNDLCNIFRKRSTERMFKEKLALEFSGMENADTRTEFKSILERVDAIIEQLPDTQRVVFRKSRFEGMTTKEIAAELHLSPGTVDNYISAALKFIRTRMEKENMALLLFGSLWIF
ncbi:RNA polymerase sigma-70 factor, Bacteroides expansion family 1 [Bacteroidales bacterium 6E]|nr:RNA polymerase sigma-70 factor, Bacteroides expansion family 1 [Bacteroidales bacterium 6E]